MSVCESFIFVYCLQQQFGPDGGHPPPIQIPKPNELFYSKIIPLLKKYVSYLLTHTKLFTLGLHFLTLGLHLFEGHD